MPDFELMPVVTVSREQTSREHGTFSTIRINVVLFCWGLEPYNYGNLEKVSCIPSGQYLCRRTPSALVSRITDGLFINTFEATYVPLRTKILFHPGNVDEDTEGCLLMGDTLGKLSDKRAILNSGETFRRFMSIMEPYNQFTLTIREAY